MGEFDLIHQYFQRPVRRAALGIGDDCALLQPAAGCQIAVSSDMLVQGTHFLADTDPYLLGHKALAVNLSDLAACGARPLAFTLALALPAADPSWLEPFSRGLLALADSHDCELVGGDTTRGPLNICITVFGEVPAPGGRSQALLRSGAHAGDDIYVSGTLGDARLALEAIGGQWVLPQALLERAATRLHRPEPRVALGQALRGLASSAIDISDGLLGDLGHVLAASGVGARLDAGSMTGCIACHGAALDAVVPRQHQLHCVLAGGDDYELAFTAAPHQRDAIFQAARTCATAVSRIGTVTAEAGLQVVDGHGVAITGQWASFDHFNGH
ncbi:MAG TPA: thiamine-phosphate kinase [Burkholderiaceae bacterium]|nr:thiamine-phosphate kinase [Burkholderiaceae bacterium]